MDTILELMRRQQDLLETALKLHEYQVRVAGAIPRSRQVHAPTSKESAVLNAALPDASALPEGVGSAEETSATAHPEGVGSDTQAQSQAMCRVEEIVGEKNDGCEFRKGEDDLSFNRTFESGAVDGPYTKPSKAESETIPECTPDGPMGLVDSGRHEMYDARPAGPYGQGHGQWQGQGQGHEQGQGHGQGPGDGALAYFARSQADTQQGEAGGGRGEIFKHSR